MSDIPRPPTGLAASGRRMWTDVQTIAELDPGEVVILREACRTADELDRLNAVAAVAEPVVEGSVGQPKMHPVFDELRRHRTALAALVGALALPDAEEDIGLSPASRRAQKAAQTRWARRDELVARRLGSGTA